MKRAVLALLLFCSATLYAQPPGAGDPPSLLPGVRQVEGPVLVTCPIIGVRIRCATCYQQDPLKYYSGGPSATWYVEVVPMYVISTPLWVTWRADESTLIQFSTLPNTTGVGRSGVIDIGGEKIQIYQEEMPR